MIDHMTGKSVPPIFNTKKSGNAVFLAIHVPSKAPINPTAIEMIQPPFENPASERPIEPHIPAITNKIIISSKDMARPQRFIES